MVKFENKFKEGDIICSNRFRFTTCMIVTGDSYQSIGGEFAYRCMDLILPEQYWSAVECDSMWNEYYDWRLANDEDIIRYLSRYVDINIGKLSSEKEVNITEYGIELTNGLQDSLILNDKECMKLFNILKKRIKEHG